MIGIIDLIVLIAAAWFFVKWRAKKKKAEELAYIEKIEAGNRAWEVENSTAWFNKDYAAFDKYLEDYHANRLFFPVHVDTLYSEDFGGYNCRDIYNVLSVLIQDMEENDAILNKNGAVGGLDRSSKIQRCKEICGKYYGK